MSVGNAELIATLVTKTLEADLRSMEKTVSASFARMAAASKGIIAKGAFSSGVAEAKSLQTALAGIGSGATQGARAVDPLNKAIVDLKNETAAYRNVVESTDASNADAVKNFNRLRDSALSMADGLDRSSDQYLKQYRDLTGVAAQAARSVKTLEGETTRLGFSGNTVVGVTGAMRTGFGQLNSAIVPLLGAVGIGGLVRAMSSFATEAQTAESAGRLFGKVVERAGLDAGASTELVERLANQFGVMPSAVQGAATALIRTGASLETVDKTLQSAGASAAGVGADIASSMEQVARGVAQGRSELLETSGITVNASQAWKIYADQLGVSVDTLTEQQKVQAYANAVYEESRYEIEDLGEVLTEQVKAQQNFRTAMAEARQELGSSFAPTLTLGANAAAGLLKSFDGLPESTQASVVGIGGVSTAAAVAVTAMNGLRLALIPLLAPPAGLIILGAVAVAALGTALFTMAQNADKNVTPFKSLSENAEATQNAIGNATDKESLAGALDALATQLDGDAKDGVTNFATEVRNAKGDVEDLKKAASDLVTQTTLDLAMAERSRMVAELKVVPSVQDADPDAIVADLQDRLNRSAEFQELGIQVELGINEEDGRYAAEVVGGIGENAVLSAEAFALLDTALNDTNSRLNAVADSAGNQLRSEIQRLDVFINQLREDLKGVQEETTDPLVPPVPPGTPSSIETTSDAVNILGLEAASAAGDLVVLNTELKDIPIPEITTTSLFTDLRNEILSTRDAYADGQDAVGKWGEKVRANHEQVGAAAQAAAQLEQQAFFDRAASRDALVAAQEELASTLAYYSREVENSYNAQEANAQAIAQTTSVIRDRITAEADWAERMSISGDSAMTAAEAQQVLVRTLTGELAAGYDTAIERASLLGEAQDTAGIKAEVARQKLEELLSQGLEPTDARVQAVAAEYQRWSEASDRAAAAQDGIKNAVARANDAVQTTGDLAGQTSKELKTYIQELDRLLAALLELERTNPELAEKLGVGDSIKLLKAARTEAEKFREELGELAKTKGELALLGEGFKAIGTGIKALGGGNTTAGVFAGLGAGLSAAADEVENIKKGLDDIAKGDFTGGIQGILGAAQAVLGAIKEAAEQTFGEDLPAEANIGFSAVEGALGGAAAGAVFGPWGAVIGGVLGGISGLFTGITAEQQKMQEEQQKITEEAIESRNAYYELAEAIGEGSVDERSNLQQTKLDFAVDSGQINEEFAKIKQAKLDMIDAYYDFQSTRDDLLEQQNQLNADLVAGTITQTEYDAQMATLNQQLADAEEALGYEVAGYLETAKQAANELGLSQEELYTALLTGDDAVLGQLGPGAELALRQSLQAYIDVFGSLPPEMQKVADDLGISFDAAGQTLAQGGEQVAGATANSATIQRQALAGLNQQLRNLLGPEAEGIIQQILQMYNRQAGAHQQGGQLTTQAASQGGQASAIQSINEQLRALLGPAADSIIAQINAAYNAQADAHTQGGQTVGAASTNAGNQALTAQGGATAVVAGKLEADRVALANKIAAFHAAQQSQFAIGGGDVATAIAAAADAENKTLQSAAGAVTGYMATVQSGLLKDIAKHATDEAGLFVTGGKNVERTYVDAQNAKGKTVQAGIAAYVGFLGKAADAVFTAARGVFDAEAAGFAGQGRPNRPGGNPYDAFAKGLKLRFPDFKLPNDASKVYETLPPEATRPFEPKDPNETKVAKPKKGSLSYIDEQIRDLEEQYANETDPAKRRKLANRIKALRKQRDNMDFLRDDGAKTQPGKGSGAGKGGGTGGGKDSPAEDKTVYGSPAWIKEQIRLIEEQIDDATSAGAIRKLQGKREKLQAQLDALLGTDRGGGGGAVDKPALRGSIDYLQEQLRQAQEVFDSATTDAARARAAERIKVLQEEIERKQAILKDAEREMDRSGSNVITIESPIANLDGIVQLGKEIDRVYANASQSLSQGLSGAFSTTAASSALAGATAPLGSISAAVMPPSYQAQLDVAGQMGAHINVFGNHISRFGNAVSRFERLANSRNTSGLVDKARGVGISDFTLGR